MSKFVLVNKMLKYSSQISKVSKTNEKPRKRVEYQKFLRVKLESEEYRGLFGLSDNLLLIGEEDLVLPREFRIDFMFEKRDESLPLEGIFAYFRRYNLCEFKSVNDPLTLLLLDKYTAQLFQWLFAKNREALARKVPQIQHEEVTLTILTVRRPREVLNRLKQYQHQIGFQTLEKGHYCFHLIGIQAHLLVINELSVEQKNYGWLTFAEGQKLDEYLQNLARNTAQDDRYEVCFNLITELEKEGRDTMASEGILRYFAELPIEKQRSILFGREAREQRMGEFWQKMLTGLDKEEKERIASEVLQQMLTMMKEENLQLSPELLQKMKES